METSSADVQEQHPQLHDDKSGQIAAVVSVMIVLATSAVALRLFTRRLTATSLKLDDYGIIAALILAYGLFVTQIVGIQYGAGKHQADVDFETIAQIFKVLMACELIYVTCLFTIKISILSLYYRLFSSLSRTFNTAVYVVAGLTVVGWVTAFLIFVLQCKPVAYAFDQSMKGHCVDFNAMCVFTSAINVVINIILLTLPLPVVWHLQVSKCRKLAISGLFLLGGSVIIISIIRVPILVAMSPADITRTESGVGTWSIVEVSIGILTACLPIMRPLLRRLILRPTTVEEPHSMQITCFQPSSNGKPSPEQHPNSDTSAKPWPPQQPCHNNSAEANPASPQRLNSEDSVMSIKQWRDPENMHPGDLWHVCNSSHGTSKAFGTGGVKSPSTTTTITTKKFGYGIWPAV